MLSQLFRGLLSIYSVHAISHRTGLSKKSVWQMACGTKASIAGAIDPDTPIDQDDRWVRVAELSGVSISELCQAVDEAEHASAPPSPAPVNPFAHMSESEVTEALAKILDVYKAAEEAFAALPTRYWHGRLENETSGVVAAGAYQNLVSVNVRIAELIGQING